MPKTNLEMHSEVSEVLFKTATSVSRRYKCVTFLILTLGKMAILSKSLDVKQVKVKVPILFAKLLILVDFESSQKEHRPILNYYKKLQNTLNRYW